MQIHALSGHDNTVCSVFTRPMVRIPLQLGLMLTLSYYFKHEIILLLKRYNSVEINSRLEA